MATVYVITKAVGKDNYGIAIGHGASAANGQGCVLGGIALGQGANASDNELVLQSGAASAHEPPASRITVTSSHIAFRIGGHCRKIGRSAFFSALGVS